ncbi:uncharacterized protein DS421_19g664230 [Arachis hypogaea]|uniref:Uncharacterized protein n=1 Tax=Arachis hypogaea TaxID=3818 RepID=A0A6B9VC77_ARAHY|nr:uncharacterized protein DS421_19g664230 [Arachis hypogaea]
MLNSSFQLILLDGTWDAENLADELRFQLNTLTATPTKLEDMTIHFTISVLLSTLLMGNLKRNF